MKKVYQLCVFVLLSVVGYAQNSKERILYIVDSIPIFEDPKEGFGTLSENVIERVEVVKDGQEIQKTGYKNVDGIVYVFTKEYLNRPDSIKAIPTTKMMTRKGDIWYLQNQSTPYSGSFIDYYLNGKKEGEGTLLNGRLKGKRLMYHLEGGISDIIHYENGIENGIEQRFYKNGALKQKGEFKSGVEVGIWEMYHPNGQLQQRTTFVNGKMDGESISYYSTGEIKGRNIYKQGVYQKDKTIEKLFTLYNESQTLYKELNYKAAIKKLDKAIEIDPKWADAYFARGTMKLNNFQFDEAIVDFNKALEIEPYFTNAYSNRAFAILRKYELGGGRQLSSSSGVQIIASKETEIPESAREKICADLIKAVELGDDNWMVLEAVQKHCSK